MDGQVAAFFIGLAIGGLLAANSETFRSLFSWQSFWAGLEKGLGLGELFKKKGKK